MNYYERSSLQVCNVDGKGFCCQVCEVAETCQHIDNCPLVQEKLDRIKFREGVIYYFSLNYKSSIIG